MPRSLARSSSRSVSGVAARSAAQSSRPIVRNRLPASITPATLRSARAASPQSATAAARKRAAPTRRRHWLVDLVVAHAVPAGVAGRRGRVLDPACGDGRFLAAAARRAARRRRPCPCSSASTSTPRRPDGGARRLGGLGAASVARRARRRARPRLGRRRSTSSSATRRTSPSWPRRRPAAAPARHGGGPYADAAAEFLALAGAARPARTADASGSCCRSRSSPRATPPPCGPSVDRRAAIVWSWWSPRPVFDAQVLVCALVFAARPVGADGRPGRWSRRRDRRARRARRSRRSRPTATLGAAGPADGELPRPVLRAGPGGRSTAAPGPPLVTSGLDRSRPLRAGAPRRSRSPAVGSDRPTVELGRLEPGDAALGRRPARAQGARRQPDRGSSRPVADPDGAGSRASR